MGGTDGLRKVIYASRAIGEPSEADLLALLEVSRSRNRALGITGMLLYAERSFLQQLEGAGAAVTAVFTSIRADGRHTDVRVLADAPVDERRFGSWWMGFDHVDRDRLQATVEGYKVADPYPLVNPQLVRNATVAETLLVLFGGNP